MKTIDNLISSVYKGITFLLGKKGIVLLVLFILFALSFLLRMYRIDNPVADWHSWRQADTAAVTRNFIKEGYTPLFPKFDSFNSLNEGNLPNPDRYFFAEFPFYNSIVYVFYTIFGVDEVYARLVSIFFASLTTIFLYLLVRKYSSPFVALTAAFLFAVMPFNIYYGRVIMPDPMHIFFGVLALYLVTIWAERKTMIWAILAGIAWAICILAKPYGLILGLPILVILWNAYGFTLLKTPAAYIFATVVLAPFLAWRWHIQNYPEGMFGTAWLFNQGDIRFTGAYFRWLIYDRMNRLIFATGGFVLFFLGLIKFDKKEGLFYYSWLASILVFFVVIARGNVTHDYYQIPLVPIGCIFIAKGVDFLWTYAQNGYQRLLNIALSIILVVLMIAFGWYEVRGYFNINRPEIVAAGEFIDQNLPQDAKVIAPYFADPAFLYQTNRYGWTLGGGLIEGFISEGGATHIAIVNFDSDEMYWVERCEAVGGEEGKWTVLDVATCQLEVEASDEAILDETNTFY